MSEVNRGCVYWITGMSGAGKTTLAGALYEELIERYHNLVLLDGDVLRKSIAWDLGYNRQDRIQAAKRYSRLAQMLSGQGLKVIIATISMFDEIRDYNRENIEEYREIYLKVPVEVLKKRNSKKVYDKEEVAGVNIRIEEPKNPDLVIVNDGRYTVSECLRMIMNKWRE